MEIYVEDTGKSNQLQKTRRKLLHSVIVLKTYQVYNRYIAIINICIENYQ